MKKLTLYHNAGFFSCCSVKLDTIINYFNNFKKLPDIVDSSRQFAWYKLNDRDVTFDYFDDYNNHSKIIYERTIDYKENYQFNDYSTLNYNAIQPFITKYFSPSAEIIKIITELEKKYDINYDNICVLFYRGNDKITETSLCEYDEYINYANEIQEKNPDTRFFIQSDETEFIERMTSLYPNSFYFKDETRHMKKQNSTVDKLMRNNIDIFSKNYLAITMLMAKCKFIICGSGNCSIWIMFYRGNNKNVYQNLNSKWIIS